MDQGKHKFEVTEQRIRFNNFGEELFRTETKHETWAKSEAKAISNIKFRLYGSSMNSVFPEDELFYIARAI